VLAPRAIPATSFDQAAYVLAPAFGRWALPLFCASLAVGCLGAALELALDLAYLWAQTFGWNWGENLRPHQAARFATVYTVALAAALVPTLFGLDPLQLTMFSMAVTVLALPVVFGPFIVLMNDPIYLKSHTNHALANTAVVAILVLSFVLAIVAIPLQLTGS